MRDGRPSEVRDALAASPLRRARGSATSKLRPLSLSLSLASRSPRATLRGRQVDGLSGAVVRLGAALTPPVPTPTHAFAVAMLAPTELRLRGELDYEL